jgi:hypothetical protein
MVGTGNNLYIRQNDVLHRIPAVAWQNVQRLDDIPGMDYLTSMFHYVIADESQDWLSGVTGTPSPALSGAHTVPNPASLSSQLVYELPREGGVRVTILDVAGRSVRRLEEGHLSPGVRSTEWDGMTDQGTTVAPGTYFYRVEIDGQALANGRVTWLK